MGGVVSRNTNAAPDMAAHFEFDGTKTIDFAREDFRQLTTGKISVEEFVRRFSFKRGHTAEDGLLDRFFEPELDPDVAAIIDTLRKGTFTPGDESASHEIWSVLMEHGDRYLHLADFRSYVEAQSRVGALYPDQRAWAAKAIRNVAAMGWFSSDRAIRRYVEEIWHLDQVKIGAGEA